MNEQTSCPLVRAGKALIDQGLNPQLEKLLVYTTVFEKVPRRTRRIKKFPRSLRGVAERSSGIRRLATHQPGVIP